MSPHLSTKVVCELIQALIGTWNVETLAKHFLPMDVEVIKSTPLSISRHEDPQKVKSFLYWVEIHDDSVN
jgi:hypothetical protein